MNMEQRQQRQHGNLELVTTTTTLNINITELDDETVFKYHQTSQSRRQKGFHMFVVSFGVR